MQDRPRRFFVFFSVFFLLLLFLFWTPKTPSPTDPLYYYFYSPFFLASHWSLTIIYFSRNVLGNLTSPRKARFRRFPRIFDTCLAHRRRAKKKSAEVPPQIAYSRITRDIKLYRDFFRSQTERDTQVAIALFRFFSHAPV